MMNWPKITNLGRQLCLYVCLLLLCCGCVQYRMEMAFNWLTGGTIVQNLKWDSSVGNFIGNYSDAATDELLDEIERRAAAAGGTANYVSDSEMRVEIPFDNYTQLESKFNAFFNQPLLLLSQLVTDAEPSLAAFSTRPPSKTSSSTDAFRAALSPIVGAGQHPISLDFQQNAARSSVKDRSARVRELEEQTLPLSLLAQNNAGEELKVTKQGFGIADRYDLTYTLDLSDIRLPVSGRFFTLSVDRLLDLQMALTTPIPASRSNATVRDGNRLEWRLDTGAVNHLSVSFWTPSPVGIALIAIAALAAFLWAWRLDRPRRRG
ncbi:MAG: DUF3153 domain-containing protein [Cyanobacteria bacterium P01_E01_bin.34]